ncbi:hypothetical protein KY361_05610 [Candidatus Woesearchaeota archaeon]|nr:hypothetical protein [Candidatus Woesearchaeota archaeon]
MELIPLVIGAAVFFIALAVIFAVVKGIMKIIFSVFSIIIVLSLVGGAFIASDFMDLRENFPNEEKTMLLKDENKALAGSIIISLEDENPTLITQEQLDSYSGYLQEDNLKAILGDKYKLIIVDLGALRELEAETFNLGEEYSKEFLISVLESDEPKSLFIEEYGEEPTMDELELKAAVFGVMFGNIGPIILIEQYKKDNIIFYPETAVFKVMRYLPVSVFKDTMQGVMSKVEEKIPA